MQTRKVQKAGRSSFVVSLPADWVKAHRIGKNEPIEMEINSDGSIAIYPKHRQTRKEDRLVVDYPHPNDKTMVLRRLIGGYIAGFDEMEIRPSSLCTAKARALASEFTNMAIGQEVVDEDKGKIVIRDIADPSEMPMGKTLKRMHYVAREVLSASLEGIESLKAPDVGEIEAMEKEVDRLQWLIARKHGIFLRYPSLAMKEAIGLPESNLYFLVSRQIERISDHALSIAKICAKHAKCRKKNQIFLQRQANALLHTTSRSRRFLISTPCLPIPQ